MFKEEWSKLRPKLANLSIWTLVSYARKFDTLKKQLIQTHNQTYRGGDRRRKDFVESPERPERLTSTIVYFDDSTIPKFDLEEVENLAVPQDLKDLVISRQNAKQRQTDQDPNLRFHLLWEQEWEKLRPEIPLSGTLLHQKLFLLENRPSLKSQLRQAILRSKQNVTESIENEDEHLAIKPRTYVFPEADQEGLNVYCWVDVALPKGQEKERWYVELERDIYSRDSLLIPMLEDGRGPADEEEEVIKFTAKAYLNHQSFKPGFGLEENEEEENFQCPQTGQSFSNINNLKYHQSLQHESKSPTKLKE